MKLVCKTKIEKAWLITSLTIFLAHRLLEAPSHSYYPDDMAVRLWLEVAMVLLSFPFGGLTLFVLQDARFWCDGCQGLEWMLDWSTLLFAGYIQWFWVLPELLRGRELTLLDLKRPPETVSTEASPSDTEPAAASLRAAPPVALETAPPVALEAAPLPAFDAAAFALMPAEFDEAGLTALDRVFQAQAPRPAPVPRSHVEAIFPRVS